MIIFLKSIKITCKLGPKYHYCQCQPPINIVGTGEPPGKLTLITYELQLIPQSDFLIPLGKWRILALLLYCQKGKLKSVYLIFSNEFIVVTKDYIYLYGSGSKYGIIPGWIQLWYSRNWSGNWALNPNGLLGSIAQSDNIIR